MMKVRRYAAMGCASFSASALQHSQLNPRALAFPAVAAIFQKIFEKRGKNFLTSERKKFSKFLVTIRNFFGAHGFWGRCAPIDNPPRALAIPAVAAIFQKEILPPQNF
jgi:hypothetical protein